MKIVSGNAPFLRSKRTTSQIMMELLIGLAIIFVAAVIYNFTLGVRYGLKTICIMTVAILFTFISDIIAGSLRYNKEKDGKFDEYLIHFIKSNYSVVTAVIFALTLPIGTPVYVVIIGSMFATLVVKHAFGGFGSNVFNPAALSRIFLALTFGSQLKAYLPGGENIGGLVAGATVTSQYAADGVKFLTGSLANTNVSMLDLYLGNHSGAIGETFTLLILIVGVVLAAREVINWRTPVFFLGTVALSSVFVSLVAKVNMIEYLLVQFGVGGMVFGAVFMFTDPVTSPTSNYGKALIGIIGALINVLIRIAGGFIPEGTAFSIAFVNIISPMIDRLITGRTNNKVWVPATVSGVMVLGSVGLITGVSAAKMPRVAPEPPPIVVEPFVTYLGSYTSPTPSEYAEEFTTNVEVGLSDAYHIVKIKYDVIANPDNYKKVTDGIDAVIDYYTSISVAEFKALPVPALSEGTTGSTVAGQTGEHIIPGAIYSSRALYEAINDALKDLNVYSADVEDYPYDSGGYSDETLVMSVDVYVDTVTDLIKVVDIKDGASTGTYADRWETVKEAVLSKYHDLDVATFLGYTNVAELYGEEVATYAGVTYSARRLFNAVQKALEGYGG